MSRFKRVLWRGIAKVIATPVIADWIIERSKKTPYFNIHARGSDDLYMERWWLFNPYSRDSNGAQQEARFKWLPSIRVHHICLPDDDEHEHDHPWDARSIILKGWYVEERKHHNKPSRLMGAGATNAISAGMFHRITDLSAGGVYTLFFTWKHVEDWGFMVDGVKVHYKKYLASRKSK